LSKSPNAVAFSLALSRLGPNCARCCRASAMLSPSDVLCNVASKPSDGWLQYKLGLALSSVRAAP
jgi:hypothetical protein